MTNSCILQSLRDSPPRKDLNVLFQINNVLAQAPGTEIHTKDGARLYVSGQLLDYSGAFRWALWSPQCPLCSVSMTKATLSALGAAQSCQWRRGV